MLPIIQHDDFLILISYYIIRPDVGAGECPRVHNKSLAVDIFQSRLAFCHALIVDAIHEISARE